MIHMMGIIKNEFWIWFNRRNIIVFILAIVALLGTFFLYYSPIYQDTIQSQMDYYQDFASEDGFRVQMYEENQSALENAKMDTTKNEKMLEFWRNDQVYCQSLSGAWKSNDSEMIAKALYDRDQYVLNCIESGIDLSMYPSILKNTKVDLQKRLRFEKLSIAKGNYEFIYENKPTGVYLIRQMFHPGSVVVLIWLICILLWNYSVWSSEYEEKTYQLLFALPISKRKIYAVRTMVSSFMTFAGCLCLMGIWFAMGSMFYGSGADSFISIAKGMLSGSQYGLIILAPFVTNIFFVQMVVQLISLFTKNSGLSLILPILILLLIYMDSTVSVYNPFSYLFIEDLLVQKGLTSVYLCCLVQFVLCLFLNVANSAYIQHQEVRD